MPHLSPVSLADTWLCWPEDLTPPTVSGALSQALISPGSSPHDREAPVPCDGLSSAQRGWVLMNILGLCVTAESWGFFFYTNIQEHIHLLRIILFKVVALGSYTCFFLVMSLFRAFLEFLFWNCFLYLVYETCKESNLVSL